MANATTHTIDIDRLTALLGVFPEPTANIGASAEPSLHSLRARGARILYTPLDGALCLPCVFTITFAGSAMYSGNLWPKIRAHEDHIFPPLPSDVGFELLDIRIAIILDSLARLRST